MVHCRKCGTENPKDSKFCKECGTAMILVDTPGSGGPIKGQQPAAVQPPSDFGHGISSDLDAVGKRMGREFSKIGQEIEKGFKRAGKSREDWFERRFGAIGPFLSGFIGFAVFIVFFAIVQRVMIDAGHSATNFTDFVSSNFILIFILAILFSYLNYLPKKYPEKFGRVRPIFTATSAATWMWIVAWILRMLYLDVGEQGLSTASSILIAFIPIVVVLIITFGYIFQSWISPKPVARNQ